jgi:tRNA (cmo5U34)-methyltransferase
LFESEGPIGDFEFDASVTRVFEDMITRSVPCYDLVQSLMITLCRQFYRPGTTVYDLGCSIAETSLRLASALPADCRIVGIDKSAAMVAEARRRVDTRGHKDRIDIHEGSIADRLPSQSASVAIISLTLQFVRPLERQEILRNVFDALQPGGALLVLEKVVSPDVAFNRLFIDKYHEFKASNGYTDDEISRKRLALENVLIPFTIEENLALIRNAGFPQAQTFFQWLNFVGFVALK